MKRGVGLKRKTALAPGKPLTRKTALNAAPLARSVLHAQSAARQQQAKPKRPRSTGPTAKVRAIVRERSGGICEWTGCGAAATDAHHRLNRKAGGRRGQMAERINQPAWLLHACRPHHDLVTSPVGDVLDMVRDFGWLLREGQDAALIPVMYRGRWALLTDDGRVLNPTPIAA